jgi:hypothetical protein
VVAPAPLDLRQITVAARALVSATQSRPRHAAGLAVLAAIMAVVPAPKATKRDGAVG